MSAVLYRTQTVCGQCQSEAKAGSDAPNRRSRWVPGAVVEEDGKIWLKATCRTHGPSRVLYCSDPAFFAANLQQGVKPPSTLPDVEDLEKRLEGKGAKASKSLVCSCDLWTQERGFTTVTSVRKQLLRFVQLHEPKATEVEGRDRSAPTFVLKLLARQCTDMEKLNRLIEDVAGLHNGPVVVEASYDRLVLLARLPDSAFQCSAVYPGLKCYLVAGAEAFCLEEMEKFQRNMQIEYADISAMCTVVVQQDEAGSLPLMQDVLCFVREHPSFWRIVVLEQERPTDTALLARSLDPMPMLEHVASSMSVSVADLVPGSAALALEPLLYIFGYGRFSLRVAPFCTFAVILANAPSVQSVPITRYFDIERFYRGVTPLLPQLRANNYRIGISTGAKLKKMIKKSVVPGANVPDLFKLITDKAKLPAVEAFVANVQIIAVHNTMDAGCVDSVRRCNCASVRTDGREVVATCTSCV